jgi:nucleotide-binding universal stress UspA family protein
MSTSRTGRVLVATSGSAASESAITFAARAAASRELPLELVHVLAPVVSAGPYGVTPDALGRDAGRRVLAQGEDLARRVASDVQVTTTLLIGSRADAVVQHAHDAALIAVGAAPHDVMGRLWSGSTVTGITARAACPVAVIPRHYEASSKPQVLVGLKSTRHADGLLSAAFAVASQTNSAVRIVHAWQMLSPYDNAVADRLPIPEWEREEGRRIEALLIDLRMAYPAVPVQVDLVHGQPARILVEAARDAGVLVISRPLHGGFVHHLGATARAVLRESECPVLVVPPSDSGVAADPVGTAIAVAP